MADLLRTAREALNLSTAFLSRFDDTSQYLEVVDSAVPVLFPEKVAVNRSTTLCQKTLDGELPPVMPDLRDFPRAMKLPAAWIPRIRSFVSVPVTLSDGRLYGTFCAAGLSSDKELSQRDLALMEVLARAAALVIEPTVVEEARKDEILHRLRPVMRAGGPEIVLQPIVHIDSGRRAGAEALSRFPVEWRKAPDIVFAEAHTVGLGHALELMAIKRALAMASGVTGYVSVNISVSTLMTPKARALLRKAPVSRLLLELSEHDAVEDYDSLVAALAPLRKAGMRLAVDDVGAGFSSLRHIVTTSPDVIKLDRSLVAGVADDGVLSALVQSLVGFADGFGATVVAEGVETVGDARRLRALGVGYAQGWLYGRPGPVAAMHDEYDVLGGGAASDGPAASGSTASGAVLPFQRAGRVPQAG